MCSRLIGFCTSLSRENLPETRGSAGLDRLGVGEVSREGGGRARGSFLSIQYIKFEVRAWLPLPTVRKTRGTSHPFVLFEMGSMPILRIRKLSLGKTMQFGKSNSGGKR